jgi:hypothetical protein
MFWIISVVLAFQESPYWLWAILTISLALLIRMIAQMWKISHWASNLINSERYEITFSVNE